MLINDVSVTIFPWVVDPPTDPLGRGPFDPTGLPPMTTSLGLVRIETDEGVEGYSFLGGRTRPAGSDFRALLDKLKPALLGRDPMDREALYQAMLAARIPVQPWVIGAVDIALWDLAGKVTGQPIYKLLGAYRDSIPVYASSERLDSIESYVAEAVEFRDMGWHAYKIHPFRVWRDDIELVRAVREGVGDSFTLMLDAAWAYNYPAALRVGKVVEELDYYWYEDPLVETDMYNMAKLRELLRIPLMATEMPGGLLTNYAPWITARATDYLRGDVAIKGGITGCIKAAHLAEAFGMNFEVHHGGNSLNNVANLHVELAASNCEFHEVMLPRKAFDGGLGLVENVSVDNNGIIHAPTGPGLGVEIDFAWIERNKTGVHR
ncbi:enolase C-terminal domain-like protein [Dactylosporangium sp. CA-233914]|uniref:enolase C-terminal domain-like protein n=1 Tax=Dactylosporangium sp. CA-233914 TaxID=3239934 RepID=UPI003D908341